MTENNTNVRARMSVRVPGSQAKIAGTSTNTVNTPGGQRAFNLLYFFYSLSASERQFHHLSTFSCWHWTQGQWQRNCLRMRRNQRDWRAAQAVVYHTRRWPCRSARQELAPGSANPTPVSRSAPCCCSRPHQFFCFNGPCGREVLGETRRKA